MIIDYFLRFFKTGQNWLTKLILIVLAITFVFGFGFSFTNFGGGGGQIAQEFAAEVNGDPITVAEFELLRQNFYSRFSQAGAPEDYLRRFVAQRAISQLIESKLLAQEARRAGFTVSDAELAESIQTNPAFQNNGRFIGKEVYRNFITGRLNQTVAQFENSYRDSMFIEKFFDFVNRSIHLSEEEVVYLYALSNEKVMLRYVEIDPRGFKTDYEPTREGIEGYYDSHMDGYMTPELRGVSYFILGPEYFESRVDISDEEVDAYYEANKYDMTREGEDSPATDGGLLTIDEARDDIVIALKKKRVEQLRERFKEKLDGLVWEKTLLQLANENGVESILESVPFAAGERVEGIPTAVARAAFGIALSEKRYIEAGRDIWLIELSRIDESAVRPIADVEEDVKLRLVEAKKRELAAEKASRVLEAALEKREGLRKAARDNGLELKETGLFTRVGKISSIGSDTMKRDAFEVDTAAPVLPKVYDAGGMYYVASLKESRGIDEKDFEAKKGSVRDNEIANRQDSLKSGLLQRLRQEANINVNREIFPPQG